MTDTTGQNRRVAELLGWKDISEEVVMTDGTALVGLAPNSGYRWRVPDFSENLMQAVDHIVPWLIDRGLYNFKWKIDGAHGIVTLVGLDKGFKDIVIQGEGESKSAQTADALCKVALKVMEQEAK